MDIKIKLMPSSPETNLEEIKEHAKVIIEENKGLNVSFKEEFIAFGLKAVIVSFVWPEDKELEPLEEILEKIENVVSEKIIDMRKSVG